MSLNATGTRPGVPVQTIVALLVLGVVVAIPLAEWGLRSWEQRTAPVNFAPRARVDTGGYGAVHASIPAWGPNATLEEIAAAWTRPGYRIVEEIDRKLALPGVTEKDEASLLPKQAIALNYEGEPKKAYDILLKVRSILEKDRVAARDRLYAIIFLQGMTALRRGENENCIMCRGESSCILPISPAARHTNPEGSRLAIKHFTEYLEQFPDDLGVCWLLNLAHMTLGEHPDKVDPRFLVTLDHFCRSEFDIGKFRDIGHIVGVNRFNQAGGAIMDDFNNDGLLDLVTTSFDPTVAMSLLFNTGKGTFEVPTTDPGLTGQLGGLNCSQTDYNNDGYLDIFVTRGAWLDKPVRPSLLRNNRDGTFTDVTREAGLLYPANSIAASWADYDNDGWLDLFVCCEMQPSRMYRNLGNGTFEEVSRQVGVVGRDSSCKGIAWIDFDNDGYQDLFLNYLTGDEGALLYRNNRDGTFRDVTTAQGIHGPLAGFSCWAWDYDNDGWWDIFATSYDVKLDAVVQGLQGLPHTRQSNRLYHNRQGRGFDDVTKQAGLDMVFATMGSNFGDFDNDGFLDMYLGTGDPDLSTLVPNRMFKNVAGQRFAEITASAGTGNLQKGHGVACGDWDRDGNTDIFIEMGGALIGDRYHNVLFQNPGHDNHWLTVKLTGQKTNRPAIGARIKIVTAGDNPQTLYRHVSSGSSFGANPLQQTIGLGKAHGIALLEVYWPTSGTTQVFRDVAMDQAIAISEFAEEYQKLNWPPIALDLPAPSRSTSR